MAIRVIVEQQHKYVCDEKTLEPFRPKSSRFPSAQLFIASRNSALVYLFLNIYVFEYSTFGVLILLLELFDFVSANSTQYLHLNNSLCKLRDFERKSLAQDQYYPKQYPIVFTWSFLRGNEAFRNPGGSIPTSTVQPIIKARN